MEVVMNSNTDSYNLDLKKLKQMIFIFNALENGWTINKKKECYIFLKKHGGKKEILDETYLTRFIEENSDIKQIIHNFTSEFI
jgi:hypothetical protein